MKVCFVDRIGAHAIWGVIAPIAARLLAENHQVQYVRMDDGGDRGRSFIPEGVEITDIKVPAKRGLFAVVQQQRTFAAAFRQFLATAKPDIVHTNFAVPSIVARRVAHHANVPVIVSAQHELYGSMRMHYRLGLRLTERYCKAVIYVSHTVAESFGRSHLVNGSSASKHFPWHVVIPNGVNISRIQQVVKDITCRVPGRIVCAGRMVPVKGQEVLVRALAQAIVHHPHLHLHLIGTGPLENHLRSIVTELELNEHVSFMGWQSHEDVLCEMAQAEVVVAPSSQEGFGLVVAEALACGTPLLLSDIQVFREVLTDFDEQGQFFSTGDVAALANKLCTFPFSSAGTRADRDLPKFNTQSLSAEAMAGQYVAIYLELMTKANIQWIKKNVR